MLGKDRGLPGRRWHSSPELQDRYFTSAGDTGDKGVGGGEKYPECVIRWGIVNGLPKCHFLI